VAESTLKVDPSFGKDKVTVSWHADSTLDHFSTIAVYHCTKPSGAADANADGVGASSNPEFRDDSWRVSMRVWLDAEGPNQGKPSSRSEEMRDKYVAPAVAVALPKKAVYYLMDDFNHHHQHAVLAGTTHRYASTHRVCRTDGHTFQSIKSRCVAALQGTDKQYAVAKVRSEQLTMSEVEFEWVRQFYIQGQKHHDFHEWWRVAMGVLLDYHSQLQHRTMKTLETLYDAAFGIKEDSHDAEMSNRDRKTLAKRLKAVLSVESDSYTVLASALREVRACCAVLYQVYYTLLSYTINLLYALCCSVLRREMDGCSGKRINFTSQWQRIADPWKFQLEIQNYGKCLTKAKYWEVSLKINR